MATRTRPVFNPPLGQFFEHLRQAARIHSQRTAAAMAARMGFPELHYNLIQRMEKGKLKSPTREHLLAVSTVYGATYEAVVCGVIEHMYGIKVTPAAETRRGGVAYPANRSITTDADTPHHAATSASVHREGTEEVVRAFEAITESLAAIKGVLVPATGSGRPHTRANSASHPDKPHGSGSHRTTHRKVAR